MTLIGWRRRGYFFVQYPVRPLITAVNGTIQTVKGHLSINTANYMDIAK